MRSLSSQFEHYISEIAALIDEYPFENREAYCRWMNQQYHLVKYSTRYLALAAALVGLDESDEFKWWCKHLSGEIDHDKVLLSDMKSLAYEPKEEALPEARALIYSQHFDIQKNGPDALLGYALVLEGLSCKRCDLVATRVESVHGKKASKFLRLHGKVDLDHFPDGLRRLEGFSPARQSTILINLHMTANLYISILKTLISQIKSEQKIAA